MAYRCSLSIRATLLARRSNPSFTYVSHDNDRSKCEELNSSGSKIETFLTKKSSFGVFVHNTDQLTGTFYRTHYGLKRDISTSTEVAIAASDSAFPSAAVQYLIDAVHSFTGFNWWASIALSTLLLHGAMLPFHLHVHRENTYKLMLFWKKVNEIKQQVQATGMEPEAVAEGNNKIKQVLAVYRISTITKELFVRSLISISFFFARENMAEKVPSFKTGGALWFTDLSSPDATFIFPVLLALIFLIPSELNNVGSMKMYTRIYTAIVIPVTLACPKVFFCYWITSVMFRLCYNSVIRLPRVKKALRIPEIKAEPHNTTPRDK